MHQVLDKDSSILNVMNRRLVQSPSQHAFFERVTPFFKCFHRALFQIDM